MRIGLALLLAALAHFLFVVRAESFALAFVKRYRWKGKEARAWLSHYVSGQSGRVGRVPPPPAFLPPTRVWGVTFHAVSTTPGLAFFEHYTHPFLLQM